MPRPVGRVRPSGRTALVTAARLELQAAEDMYAVAVRIVDEDAAEYEIDEAETARLRGQRT